MAATVSGSLTDTLSVYRLGCPALRHTVCVPCPDTAVDSRYVDIVDIVCMTCSVVSPRIVAAATGVRWIM